MPVRILMISDVYFPRINGVSTSIQTFRRCLEALGHETLLIAPGYPGRDWNEPDAALARVASRHVPRDPEDRMMKSVAVRGLLPQLRGRAFDIVHIQTPFVAHYAGVALARELGLPVVESYHTYFEEYLHHYVPCLPAALLRSLARRFTVSQCKALDALVVPSRAMQQALEGYGVSCPMQALPTGLDLGRFRGGDGARFRGRLGIAADRPVLVYVGRIAHEKNIDFLLRMLAELRRQVPAVLLVIAGEGPALPHCRRLVERLNLRAQVRFVGYLARETELLDCYRAGDLFVFSSRTETQGLVLLEAMALGVPVVSTAHMGTIDILEPEHGCRIAPDDERDFARMVAELLDDLPGRQAMSAAAREYAGSWSASAMTARLVALYADVCERAGPALRPCESATERARSADEAA